MLTEVITYDAHANPRWSVKRNGTEVEGVVEFDNTSNPDCRIRFKNGAAFGITLVDINQNGKAKLYWDGKTRTDIKLKKVTPNYEAGGGGGTATLP